MGTGVKAIAPRTVLAGDIGGTNTRLALFRGTRLHFHRIVEETFPGRDYQRLEEVLRDFLKEKMEIKAVCFGVAGPVNDGKVTATNLPWHLDCRLLQKGGGFLRSLIPPLLRLAAGRNWVPLQRPF